ncbi:MAG TPA: M1 family metallopeptidase, partial [Terriglobales bacterium]|nr:M1 family metallopeptidase [Terriglobales bacterium]
MRRIWVLFLLLTPAIAQRLPQTVVPSHYKLALDPSIEQKRFSGEETIDVRLTAATREIVLNSLDLDVSEAQFTVDDKTTNANVVYDKPNEMVKLELGDQIPAGQGRLHLKFSGKLIESLRGLYLSKSSRRQYAVTQFEGTYARMMFPSFDEPSFKATFDLTVTADKGDTAISNGQIIRDEPLAGGRHQISFSTSPKMSTYLVALAIGDWQCLERTIEGVPIRVCAAPEKKQFCAFALDVAAHSIQFYNHWYGIKYPFGKLDMLAIPDYEWGGMENTASIFYRESALLLDEKSASVLRKRSQASTIAHEIAHQWFGDLVTAAWWDDIWLNEGFATWMSSKPIEAWHPEWHLDQEAAARAQHIIALDSLTTARAIHGNPSTPSDIKEMFDGITYEKGGAVLRMLESYLGPEVFRKGVNAYLAAHANGNATSADFWQAEAEASGKPVDKIMPTFVMQPGVPLVNFATSCEKTSEKLQLTQRRFLISPDTTANSNDPVWQIPVCTKT